MPDEKKPRKKWTRFRHRFVCALMRILLYPYCRLRYGYTFRSFREVRKRPFLILYNHQTVFDQFLLGLAFPTAVYYVASEDIFSSGFVSRLIEKLVAPIPIKKSVSDVKAVRNCVRVAREGGTIALAPEGNRTYSGTTEDIRPAIASFVKMLNLPVAFFRFSGGYGVHPRWADKPRRGRMTGRVTRVLEPEEYAVLSKEELYALICKEMAQDDRLLPGPFRTKKPAEGLERVLYWCPECGLTRFRAEGARVSCEKCGFGAEYGGDLRFRGKEGFPFASVKDWYDAQKRFVSGAEFPEGVLAQENVSCHYVIPCDRKLLMYREACLTLTRDAITVECLSPGKDIGRLPESEALSAVRTENGLRLPVKDCLAFSCVGKNKLTVYYRDIFFQLRAEHLNALEFVNLAYHLQEGGLLDVDGNEFLGL